MNAADLGIAVYHNHVIIRCRYKTGYNVLRRFRDRKQTNSYVDRQMKDSRILFIDIIPPQNYNANRMEEEADKGGYSIEKYQKIFGI